MFKVVSEDNHNEVWAIGFSKIKLENRIRERYYHNFMYEGYKNKNLIVIEEDIKMSGKKGTIIIDDLISSNLEKTNDRKSKNKE